MNIVSLKNYILQNKNNWRRGVRKVTAFQDLEAEDTNQH